ncbi:MAG: hypothetical protein V4556_13655 [Bacteroidota bacterium]
MAETKEHTNVVDHHFVDPKDATEIEYLHSKYPWISEKVIRETIIEKGPERKNIEDFLERYNP